MTLCWCECVARRRETWCSARGEGLTGCCVGVCCQERGCCVYVARRKGLIGCVGVCCQERGIDRVCWCMLPGERD